MMVMPTWLRKECQSCELVHTERHTMTLRASAFDTTYHKMRYRLHEGMHVHCTACCHESVR